MTKCTEKHLSGGKVSFSPGFKEGFDPLMCLGRAYSQQHVAGNLTVDEKEREKGEAGDMIPQGAHPSGPLPQPGLTSLFLEVLNNSATN